MLYKYIVQERKDLESLKKVMEETAELLTNNKASVDEYPGILLGMIQSGKTRAYIGILAKCFDEGYDVAIILTKSSRPLVAQTVRRIKSEFKEPVENDYLSVHNIMELPTKLTPFVLRKKLVFVAKKEDDNLRKLHKLFFEKYKELSSKRVLIIDDEADFASVTYARDKGMPDGIKFGVLASMISDFRSKLTAKSDYLQVTATPYSLYLQPEEIIINSGIYAPLKPGFTKILQPFPSYMGGKYYFEESLNQESPASHLYIPVPESEFEKLKKADTRYINTILYTKNLRAFRLGLINFLVGGSIRLLQESSEEDTNFPWRKIYKCSYLIHTEQRTNAHRWQSTLTNTLISRLQELISYNKKEFNRLIKESYDNLFLSISKTKFEIPALEDTIERAKRAVIDGEISVKEVNSVEQIIHQLDDKGQLKLDNPFNIFIGGQALDRGITVDNLIGFFYGRNPKTFQMDTVLQHSRMYGARNPKDLAVSRIYTSPRIYCAMQRMYHFDKALRESIKKLGNDAAIRFIESDPSGGIRPCSPSKLRISQVQVLKSYSRFLPIGFQTVSATKLSLIVKMIENILCKLERDEEGNYLASVEQAIQITKLISSTFEFKPSYNNEGWEWDITSFNEIMRYAASFSGKDRIIIIHRENRDLSRMKNHNTAFSNAPDDGRNDLEPAQRLAQESPVLMLLKQIGNEDKGWRGHFFYWPVLITPRITRTSVYTES